jgi:hypothetical protein
MSSFQPSAAFARVLPAALKNLLVILLTLITGLAYGQAVPDTGSKAPASKKDSILSIRNLSSQKDTIRNKEIIAITIQTSANIDTLKTLYIGGIAVPGLAPWKVNPQDKTLYFTNSTAVQALLLQFLESNPFDKSFVPVYLGIGSQHRLVTAAKAPVYVEVRQKINYWWVIVVAVLIAVLVVVALSCNILKDDNNLYYSLGRTQLFFWTLLLMIAYLQICLKTDSLPDIPLSILAIIGISVTTTAASKLIENKTKVGAVIDATAKSEGWLLDILSDGSSINIQRFQNVAFNVFFGIIFIQKAISTHLLPDFDQNVLLLLGISSGAYAGLKMTEAAKEQNAPALPTNEDIAANPSPAPVPAPQNVNPNTEDAS